MTMHTMLDLPEKHPRWATDADTTLEPAEGRKDEGWPVDHRAPARWMNWLQNLFARWSRHVGTTAVSNYHKNAKAEGPILAAVSNTGAGDRVQTSLDGENWDSQVEAEANQWVWVAYSPELKIFVGVAATGTNKIMWSRDGITWNAAPTAGVAAWNSVAWGNGMFVAVGNNAVARSRDGINWNLVASPAANNWASIAYSPALGIFCAVENSGANVVMVGDGLVFNTNGAAGANQWNGICWSPGTGLFCAVCDNGAGVQDVMTSPDGSAWTLRNASASDTWQSVAWSEDLTLFCAVSQNNGVMTSPDGINWTSRTSAGGAGQTWMAVTWADGLDLFVAVAQDGANQVQTSPDGINWTAQSAAAANQWRGVVEGLAGINTAGLIYHPDLIRWCLAPTDRVTSYLSVDGHAWSAGGDMTEFPKLHSIGIDLTRFLVGDTVGNIQYSTDGATWSQELSATIGGAGDVYSLCTKYPDSNFLIALRDNNVPRIAASGIGGGWVAATTPPAVKSIPIRVLYHEGSTWVIGAADVGYTGFKTYVSDDDGDTWAASGGAPTAGSKFYDMAINPETGVLVVVGETAGGLPAIEYSTDLGETWSGAGGLLPPYSLALGSVYYLGGDLWVCVGEWGAFLNERLLIGVSTDDGATWIPADTFDLALADCKSLTAIACDGLRVMLAGLEGLNVISHTVP